MEKTIQAIRDRHSVRNYREGKIEKEKLAQLNEMIAKLNEQGNLNVQLLEDAGDTFNRFFNRALGLGSAPSVIICAGPDDDTLDERVGYYGEQLVLFAKTLGLDTCWAGTFNRKKTDASLGAGERVVIVIAIGYAAKPGNQHKSKTAEQVSGGTGRKPAGFDFGVEMALLAPTAINQQKFEITYDNDNIEIKDLGGILSKVDLGIVKYHFEVGSKYAAQ